MAFGEKKKSEPKKDEAREKELAMRAQFKGHAKTDIVSFVKPKKDDICTAAWNL